MKATIIFILVLFFQLNLQAGHPLENTAERYKDAIIQGTQALLKEQAIKDTEERLENLKAEAQELLEIVRSNALFFVQLQIDNIEIEGSRREGADFELQQNIMSWIQKTAEIRNLDFTLKLMKADAIRSNADGELALSKALEKLPTNSDLQRSTRLSLSQQMANSAASSYTRSPSISWNPSTIGTNLNLNFEQFKPLSQAQLIRRQITNWAAIKLKKQVPKAP